jgi:hypothetical protein
MAYAYPDKYAVRTKVYCTGLIEFVEMDFEEYTTLLNEKKFIPLIVENYQTIRSKIFDVAKPSRASTTMSISSLWLLNNILIVPFMQSEFEAALLVS